MRRRPNRFLTRIFLIALLAWAGAHFGLQFIGSNLHPLEPLPIAKLIPDAAPDITAKRITHILYGDKTGGGHLHGQNKPCKSEFPADWDANKVVSEIKSIAANDNVEWKQQDNGYHVGEKNVGPLRVRVVLNEDRSEIITAYPVNVRRNPCPRPANDN